MKEDSVRSMQKWISRSLLLLCV